MVASVLILIISLLICIYIWRTKKNELIKKVAIDFANVTFSFLFVINCMFLFTKVDRNSIDINFLSYIIISFFIVALIRRIIIEKF